MNPQDPEFFKQLLDHMSDGVYFVDRERRITYWNEGASRLTGYTASEIVGRFCHDDILCHVDYEGKNLCQCGCPLAESMLDAQGHEATLLLRHKQGRRIPVLIRVQPLFDADGKVIGAVEIFSDNTIQAESIRKIEELRRMAFLDHLTQLPNRRFLEISMDTALNEFRQHKSAFGVVSLDLDRLKEINDSHGHAVGDSVLKETASTLKASFRSSDVVGRWGGDEFIAIVYSASGELLHSLARRCVSLVSQTSIPLTGGGKISPTVSAGAALIESETSIEDLLRLCDERLYRSKRESRNRANAA